MRSFLLIILAILYLVISVGFINHNVYCQGRLIKTSLTINNRICDKCPYCAKKKCKKDGNCCKHSQKHIQLKIDQNYTSHNSDIVPLQIAILEIFLSRYITPDPDVVNTETYPATNAPPSRILHSIHILNCTYLI